MESPEAETVLSETKATSPLWKSPLHSQQCLTRCDFMSVIPLLVQLMISSSDLMMTNSETPPCLSGSSLQKHGCRSIFASSRWTPEPCFAAVATSSPVLTQLCTISCSSHTAEAQNLHFSGCLSGCFRCPAPSCSLRFVNLVWPTHFWIYMHSPDLSCACFQATKLPSMLSGFSVERFPDPQRLNLTGTLW